MTGKVSKASKLAAWVLVAVNFVSMVSCVLLFLIALWIVSSPSSLNSCIQNFGSPSLKALLPPSAVSVQLGVGLAVVTIFIFTISLMGFCGAVTRSQFLLFMYATLVILVLLLECALVFYFCSNFLEKGLQEQDGQWTHALRIAFKCCEHNRTSQSGESLEIVKPPWSCCGESGFQDNCTSSRAFNTDCQTTITSWINQYQTMIYASMSALHGVLSLCSLLRRSSSASRSHS